MFAVCTCARYQVNPKVSHLYAVKRIFRYLKGQPKLGLWYPKDSPFDLVAYTDSDYAGASLDRKSTTGGCQFLGCRLISWQCKKQTVVANSITEAEYVAASRKAKKSVKLIMEKLLRIELELMLAKTINGEVQLHALVDGKKIIITEGTVRRDLQLADKDGVYCLLNSTIFEQLVLMGFVQVFLEKQLDGMSAHKRIYIAPSHIKKIFRNIRRVGKGFSGRVTPLFPTMVIQNQSELGKDEVVHKELGNSLVRAATTTSSLEAEQDSGNITKTRYKATPNESSSLVTTSGGGPRRSVSTRCKRYIGDFVFWDDMLKDMVALYFGNHVLWTNITMSDSEDSTVTYTQVSSPFEDSPDVGSTVVDGPPVMPEDPYAYIVAAYQAPPSPDYMPSPEEPQSPPPLDFVLEPMYPEYMPLEDEILPVEEQPLPAAASPTADSPGYVPESDPEDEPEADDDEDPEEDPADYPADQDDDEEEEEEPSRDDSNDEDEDEEEEHPAPADSVPPVHRMTARISIWDKPFISLHPREEVEQLLALTTPPPSPLTPL
ncbi:hypothetical protein Tco_0419150 [Tanacetum coccineum]